MKGVRSNNALFDDETVILIRKSHEEGKTTSQLAREYGCETIVIWRIITGYRYKDLPLFKYNRRIRGRKWSDEKEKEIFLLYLRDKSDSYSWSDLMRILNTSRGHLRNIIKRWEKKYA